MEGLRLEHIIIILLYLLDKNSSYTDHGSSRSIDLDGNSLSGTIQNDSNTDKYLYVGSITITAPTTFTVTFL